jgi:hypothetical protein
MISNQLNLQENTRENFAIRRKFFLQFWKFSLTVTTNEAQVLTSISFHKQTFNYLKPCFCKVDKAWKVSFCRWLFKNEMIDRRRRIFLSYFCLAIFHWVFSSLHFTAFLIFKIIILIFHFIWFFLSSHDSSLENWILKLFWSFEVLSFVLDSDSNDSNMHTTILPQKMIQNYFSLLEAIHSNVCFVHEIEFSF